MQTKTQIIDRNFEILDKYSKDVNSILSSTLPLYKKKKALFSAKYWADYFMRINNSFINEYLQEKP